MKMEPIVSSETSAIKSQTPGNYPKRNKLHLQHGESLRTRLIGMYLVTEQSHITTIHAIRLQVSYNIKMKLRVNTAGVRVSQKRTTAAKTRNIELSRHNH